MDNGQTINRPEFIREVSASTAGIVDKKLGFWERLYGIGALRKSVLLILMAILWEAYARQLNNPLLLPTLSATLTALVGAITHGPMIDRVIITFKVLFIGYGAGALLAILLVIFAISSKVGNDLLETLTAMFNPLPSIALLPLALIWFGLGLGSLVFVMIQSVMWPIALNTHSGFRSVSSTLRMVGRNYGLRGLPFVIKILVPAAFPSILTGFKIGWAFAWRTLIAAEFVFGVGTGKGGLGWYIYENKNMLNIPEVFGGLFTVILIGLFIQNVIFARIEARTVQRWGMQS